MKKILKGWEQTSVASKYHALFATSSIKEACEYYRLFKEMKGKDDLPDIRVTCLFDPSIDNDGGATDKEEAWVEILTDYNTKYGQTYRIASYQSFKKDVSWRLAHKEKYRNIKEEDKIDLLIVVDQMLTGFDSKWINTLYLDKLLGSLSTKIPNGLFPEYKSNAFLMFLSIVYGYLKYLIIP